MRHYEITQRVDVFVVDLFNTGHGEAAKALALEQQVLCGTLRTLVLVEFFKRGHEGLLKKLILQKFLNVKHDVFTVSRCRQKTAEPPDAADGLFNKPLSQRSKSNGLHCCRHLSGLSGLQNRRLVFELQIQGWQSSWRVAQSLRLCNTGR